MTGERYLLDCEKEQLHLSGAIQPFGMLLCLDNETHIITHVSANCAVLLGLTPDALLGQDISILPWLAAAIAQSEGPDTWFYGLGYGPVGPLDVHLIRGERQLVELEPSTQYPDASPSAALHIKKLATERDLQREHEDVLLQLRDLSGFQRLMIYYFHQDWSGEVIAELTTAELGSYLGLRFPPSDIPAIARNLYFMNPARSIPDATARPVDILSRDGSVPDLSRSDLRSVSPVHLQYLANMGVHASFSIPIKINQQLWGLVACHHQQAHILSPSRRAACVELVKNYSLSLSIFLVTRRIKLLDSLNLRINQVLMGMDKRRDKLGRLGKYSEAILELMKAHGLVVAIGNDVISSGLTPVPEDMAYLDEWFVKNSKDAMLVTDSLRELFPENLKLASVGGVCAVKLQSQDYGWVRIYWFRQSETQQITWAGNPNKPSEAHPSATKLLPRRSFEKWIETRSGYCKTWNTEDKLTASKFCTALNEVL